MKYKEIIINIIRNDADTLLKQLRSMNHDLNKEEYTAYDELFGGDDILNMISWIQSLENYILKENN